MVADTSLAALLLDERIMDPRGDVDVTAQPSHPGQGKVVLPNYLWICVAFAFFVVSGTALGVYLALRHKKGTYRRQFSWWLLCCKTTRKDNMSDLRKELRTYNAYNAYNTFSSSHKESVIDFISSSGRPKHSPSRTVGKKPRRGRRDRRTTSLPARHSRPPLHPSNTRVRGS